MIEPPRDSFAMDLLRNIPHFVVRDRFVVATSPALDDELGHDMSSILGVALADIGRPLDDTQFERLVSGDDIMRVRLSVALRDVPIRLRMLGSTNEGVVIEVRSLAHEYRLESLLRRSDYGHMVLRPSIELEWSMTSNALASVFPGDDPMKWVELMDPDDMQVLGTAIAEVGADPNLTRVVRHRLNADRTYSIIDTVESAVHDPDIRGVLVRSRLEDDVMTTSESTGSFAGTAVSDHMPLGVIMASHSGKILHRNAVAWDLIDARAGLSLLADSETDCLLSGLSAEHLEAFNAAFATAVSGAPSHVTVQSPADPERWLRFSIAPSAASTIVILVEDMTDLAVAEQAVKASNRLLEALDTHSEELVLVFDADGERRYASSSVPRLLGTEEAPRRANDVFAFLHPDDRISISNAFLRVQSEPTHTESIFARILTPGSPDEGRWHQGVVTNLLDDANIQGVVWTLRDVHERHIAEIDLEFRASHDELTALPERAAIQRHLAEALETNEHETAVVFCDVDNFKLVNDSVGHDVGDLVLAEVAARLRSAVRSVDLVGRFGGDEFVIVAPGITNQNEAVALAERVFAAACGRATCNGVDVEINLSMGVAISSPTMTDAGELMKHADIAMYEAKRGGRGRFELFTPGMGDGLRDRLRVQADLVESINRRELLLHYQPIIPTGATPGLQAGFEGLARWRHPDRGMIDASLFIPVAEESGLMESLGAELLRLACSDLDSWSSSLHGFVAINMSPSQLRQNNTAAKLIDGLTETGTDPSRIVVELTEASLAHGSTVLENLRTFRRAGMKIYLDDFGTGYSSLSQLRRFPVDGVKIDRAFISPSVDTELVSLIVGVAKSLGIHTVAEGVETQPQLDHLAELGVDLAQGYLLGRPQPVQQLVATPLRS